MGVRMLAVIKGAGDLASGIALRLYRSGFNIVMTEIAQPTAVRRTVCFSEAVRRGETAVEGIGAALVQDDDEMNRVLHAGKIPVCIDPEAAVVSRISPNVVIDAILAKRNLGTTINDAPVVIGVGPGFCAGKDCHAVIETMRGHTLGRVISSGSALPNTGVPGNIGGFTTERLLRAPAGGIFEARAEIGDTVQSGDTVAAVSGKALYAGIDGIVRGLLPTGLAVTKGMKAGDIDPRCEKFHCFTVSDKALAIAGGVLEAILHFGGRPN
jgi:xanthine dehydrogenase accessory factor